jgi:hypothetical protein
MSEQLPYRVTLRFEIPVDVTASTEASAVDRAMAECYRQHPSLESRDFEHEVESSLCADCGKQFPFQRFEAGYENCLACSQANPIVDTYVLSASGFKNNGAELVRVEQHFKNQQDNHVRG